MYFFYIDESGNRDVNTDEPYVLTAVGMYERQWHNVNKHLMGMKTNIARKYDTNIRQDQLEVKANLLTKPKARQDSPFFKLLTDGDIDHISKNYFDSLEQSRMAVISIVIDKKELYKNTTAGKMDEIAYEMLLERIQHYMRNEHNKHGALIIMDDAGPKTNRGITLMHARLLSIGNYNMDFNNIIEYPFFVPSELSNGVQLADLVAYTIYHTFRYNKPDYPHLNKILPLIVRHAGDPNSLAGLKIWPTNNRFVDVFNAIQRKIR